MGFFDDVSDFFTDTIPGAASDVGGFFKNDVGGFIGDNAPGFFSSVFNDGIKPVVNFAGNDVLKPILGIFQNFGNNFNNLLGSPLLLPAVIAVVILIIILK